jgi:hypothetical protein
MEHTEQTSMTMISCRSAVRSRPTSIFFFSRDVLGPSPIAMCSVRVDVHRSSFMCFLVFVTLVFTQLERLVEFTHLRFIVVEYIDRNACRSFCFPVRC